MAVKHTVIPSSADNWYVSFNSEGQIMYAPVSLFLSIFDETKDLVGLADIDVMPIVWDRVARQWVDGRMMVGFRTVARVYAIEPQFLATEETLQIALAKVVGIKKPDIDGLIANNVAQTIARMIADKQVATVLSSALPPGPPSPLPPVP